MPFEQREGRPVKIYVFRFNAYFVSLKAERFDAQRAVQGAVNGAQRDCVVTQLFCLPGAPAQRKFAASQPDKQERGSQQTEQDADCIEAGLVEESSGHQKLNPTEKCSLNFCSSCP